MDGLKSPAMLVLDSNNLAKIWKSWKEEFTLFTDLTMPEADKGTKAKLFYSLIGERGWELLEMLSDRTSTRRSVMALFDGLVIQQWELRDRSFFVRNQGLDENINKYVDLRVLSDTCVAQTDLQWEKDYSGKRPWHSTNVYKFVERQSCQGRTAKHCKDRQWRKDMHWNRP